MPKQREAKARPGGSASVKAEDRFDMKIDLTDDREAEVSQFLRSFKGKREASRMVKQLLYEHKTGRDWFTGRPLHTGLVAAPTAGSAPLTQAAETSQAAPVIFNADDLDALDED